MRIRLSTRSHRRRKCGFTLLELLAATVITAILVALMAQMTNSVLSTWVKSRSKIRKNMDARSAIELIVQDVQSIVMMPTAISTSTEWLHKTVESGLGQPGGYTADDVSWVMLLAAPVDRDLSQPAEICAISYRLGYEDQILGTGNIKLFGLYRTVMDASTTFDLAIPVSNLLNDFWNDASAPVDTRNDANFLIPHIIDFKVLFRAKNPPGSVNAAGVPVDYIDIPAGSDVRMADALTVIPAITDLSPHARLDSLVIEITLVSEEGAKRLELAGVNQDQIIREHTTSYTRRISLHPTF